MASTQNPFPGMNPFLERNWSDTHTLLIGYVRDALASGGLPEGLRARAEERLAVEEAEELRQTARADVAVTEAWRQGEPPSWTPRVKEGDPVVLACPNLIVREPRVDRWVEIRSAGGRLITVIEILSPANKTGLGRDRYLRKRELYEESGVNVVEIDLLRGGSPTVAAELAPPRTGTRYTVCVLRAAKPDRFEVYHWGLGDRIPAFGVPLRPGDDDAPLDLQPLLDRAYELGYYWQDLPDLGRLDPPLDAVETELVENALRDAALAD